MPETKYEYVDIKNIQFDLENPRIIKELNAIEESERKESAAALLILSFSFLMTLNLLIGSLLKLKLGSM